MSLVRMQRQFIHELYIHITHHTFLYACIEALKWSNLGFLRNILVADLFSEFFCIWKNLKNKPESIKIRKINDIAYQRNFFLIGEMAANIIVLTCCKERLNTEFNKWNSEGKWLRAQAGRQLVLCWAKTNIKIDPI